MKGWISKKWMTQPIARPSVDADQEHDEDRAHLGQPCFSSSPAVSVRERDDRADGEVDSAGEDDERHPDRRRR